tara:strand:+ start:1567 stop:2595 length:1029 start_codon:yes stop_codon:yes gene_type:complete
MFQLKDGKTTLTDSGMIAVEKHLDRRLKRLAAPVVGVTMLVSGVVGWGLSSYLNQIKVTTEVEEKEEAKQKLASIERDYEIKFSSVESRFNILFEKIYNDAYANNNQLLALQESVVQKSAKVEVARLTAQNAVDNLAKLSENASQLSKAITDFESAKSDIINTVTANLKSDFEDNETLTDLFSLLPIGSVIAWPGNSPPTDSWKECKAYATAPYNKNLADALSNLYGNPLKILEDSTIRLPNFEGMFLRGATGDRIPGSKQDGQVGSHTHPIFGGTQRENTEHITNGDNVNDHPAWAGSFGGPAHYEIKAASTDDQFGYTYSNNGKETRPENIGVIWLIRIK